MEAIQFHPTGSVPTDILMTEGCRGDGGTLLDVNEYRFMPDYEPEKAELASRDVVSRRMTEHMRKGFGVKSPYGDHLWLDIRHLGEHHITTKLREIYDICTHFLGVNPIHQLIPVRPTQHYSMGGVRTDKDGHAYGLKGLFAAGEAAVLGPARLQPSGRQLPRRNRGFRALHRQQDGRVPQGFRKRVQDRTRQRRPQARRQDHRRHHFLS